VVAVRKAVRGQLEDEMGGRDEGRAARYVSTVRPAKAAAKYVRPDLVPRAEIDTGRDRAGEGAALDEDEAETGKGGEALEDKAMAVGRAVEEMLVEAVCPHRNLDEWRHSDGDGGRRGA
jgi:hypothetical protein